MTARIPGYLPPYGGPRYWRDEVSGELRTAIEAFLDREREPTPQQLGLLKEYIVHWINAPCWRWPPDAWPRLHFETLVRAARNREDLWKDLYQLLDVGIDPL